MFFLTLIICISDHPEDEMPLLDDLSTTVRPTPGFLLTTTTISPVTQMSQDCVYDNKIFPDGALIKTEKACDHCYCMKGDIVCVVQECGTPMENEGKNCTALLPREGVCCPDTYICEGDESSTGGTYEPDVFTTNASQEKITTLSPPRRTSSEGSGYRNEPDEAPYTESPILEPEVEGSGETEEPKQPDEITSENIKPESNDDILASTEETHEFIPLTTTKPKKEEETITEVSKDDDSLIGTGDIEKTTEAQQRLPSTTDFDSTIDVEEPITDRIEDIGSGDLPEDMGLKPHEEVSVKPVSPDIKENVATTEIYEDNIITSFTEQESSEPQTLVTNAPFSKEVNTDKTSEQDSGTNEISDLTTPISTIKHDVTTAAIPIVEEGTSSPGSIKPSQTSEETATKDLEPSDLTTLRTPIIEEEVKKTTKSAEQDAVTTVPDDFIREENLGTQLYPSSTVPSSSDDDFVTTEAQEIVTDRINENEFFEPQHVTASTPMLEEIEKDTTEYTAPELVVPSDATQDDTFDILSTTISNIPIIEKDKDVTESTISEEQISDLPGTTNIPVFDQQEQTTTTVSHDKIPEAHIDTNVKESFKPEDDSSSTTTTSFIDNERKTTPDLQIVVSEDGSERHDGSSTTASVLVTEEATTEPNKELNTIPSEGIDKEIPESPEVQKSTTTEETVITQADLTIKPTTEIGDIISSTISDTSVSREEQPSSTTESAFRKEDYSPTETEISPKPTTVTASVTDEVISTLTHDHTTSTESVSSLQHETDTTSVPKYTESIEETTIAKEISDVSYYESFTSEASVSEIITEKPTTATPLLEKETTTANQEDNEIFNEPRIPGEGDCLLNGVTYTNESAVPSTNKCQSGCKCISSIIKCDPIICSPPPEYMNNCETMYDTPDACCPTFICDHKTETIPPESHSQMSGTEAPVISPVHCKGEECKIDNDEKHHDKPSDACKTESCAGSSDESKETAGYPHSENIPEKPTISQNEECVGDECKQILCTSENGCQATPVQPCEGEKCETSPDVNIPPETQVCPHGEDCAISNIPAKECIGNNCDTSSTQPEGTHPTEICTGKEGCLNIPQLPEDKCKEDNCRRKDSPPLDQHISEPCTASDCQQIQTDFENSVGPALGQTTQSIDEDGMKEVTETTKKPQLVTESSEHTHSVEISGLPESDEIVTKPVITRDESLTTKPDIIELVTKPEPEVTTEKYSDKQETTISDSVTEKKESLFTESPEYQSTISAETTKIDSDIRPSAGDVEAETTDISIKQQETINTERPQEFITTEKLTSAKTSDVPEPTDVYTSEAQEPTEPAEKLKPETETSVFLEGGNTESSVPFTVDSYETSKPSIDIQDEISTDIVIESSTEPPKTLDDMKKPDILEHTDTTITIIKERTTEPSITYVTELGETEPTKSTYKDDKYTEHVSQKATEPTVIDTNEQERETDRPSEYDASTVSAIDNLQGITVSKLPDATNPPAETENKDTPSEIPEETATESSQSVITESLDITKSPESFDQEVSTHNVLEKTSTEPSMYYTDKQHEITGTQESEKTTVESITVPSKTQTETQSVTKSLEEIERDGIITITGTETTESYATVPQVSDNIYRGETTSKISEESSSEPSKIFDADEPTTQSSDQSDHKYSIPNIYEESSETSVTDLHTIPKDVDQKDITSEIPDHSGTEPINVYPIEPQEDDKSPIEIDQETTTDNIDEFVTKPPKSFDTEPDISKLPEEGTTSKISQATEKPLSYTTASEDTSEESIITTVKEITESASEPSKAEDEVKLFTIPEIITTSQEQMTSKSDELTTLPTVSASKITKPQENISKETTDTTTYLESKPPHIEGATESFVKEEVSTTPLPIDHDVAITATSLSSDLDQTKYSESTTKVEPQSPDIETQTISSPTSTLEEVSLQTDTGTQVTAIVSTESDELRTTPSEIHDLTTSKSIEVSQLPHDVEIKTEQPEISHTSQQEQNTDGTFEEPSATEKPVKPEIISTDNTASTASADSITEIEFGTEPSQMSSESKPTIQESYTEESVSKYSSPEPSTGYDASTEAYPDENTVGPIHHDSKEQDKPTSLVTEQYESDTKPPGFEKDSVTQTPLQPSSTTSEDANKTTQPDVKDELSTPSSIPEDTTRQELEVVSTEYEKPIAEDIKTEFPSNADKIESETTTHKKYLPEDDTVTQEPPSHEPNEVVTSTITEHKSTTQHADMPVIDITTETIPLDTSITEEQKLSPSDKPSVDLHETPTESSYSTEKSKMQTESTLEITNVPDVQVQTEISDAVSEPETPTDIEIPSKPISEEHDSTSEDQRTTETLELGKKQTESTTLEPSSESEESSQFEPTTTSKQDFPEGSSSPSEEVGQTDKIEVHRLSTSVAGEFTTESMTSERYTEKQPEILQTVTPEKATPVEEYVTTRKQMEPEVYQTTEPTIEVNNEMSTRPPVLPEESSTTMTELEHELEHKPATEEQSIPVIISETEKTTPEESIAVQTERVIPASEKPIQETTAPEEEFIIATSKATTAKPEVEISTMSPSTDRTSKPSDTLAESYSTTAPDVFITAASEEPASVLPEEPVTTATDAFATSTPEALVTKISDVPVTTEAEAFITKTPEAPVTSEPEVPTTKTSEEAITNAPAAPITSTPEAPKAPITNAPETPITNAPEVPISSATEAPITEEPEAPITSTTETSITSAPEAPITSTPEAPEISIINVPEASITSAPEAPKNPITDAPEAMLTNAPETPEAPITDAPEAPITISASKVPSTDVPKAPIVSASEAPEAPITNAPETPITNAPEVPETPISSAPEASITNAPEEPITKAPEEPIESAPEEPITSAPETPITNAPVTAAPELPKPVSTEAQPTDEVLTPDEEGSFPPSSGTSGYGQEPDYVEEDQTFGPGTCRYGGKVYVSAQQIPRDDPCDFCFCFRSDIICLQQSCPPPIHGCHEEPIQGFCCPRYECPVSMATTVNVTTTTTTTTTTLPPHFPTHSYKGSVQKRGCQIKGQTYKVGEVVRASSGPCLHCT